MNDLLDQFESVLGAFSEADESHIGPFLAGECADFGHLDTAC